MKKAVLLSIALITAAFLTATAQNDISIPKKYPGEKTIFESPNFETLKLPAIKKAKSGQVWWEPDTAYCYTYITDNEIAIRRNILEYRYHLQGLMAVSIEQNQGTNSWINSSSVTRTYDSNDNLLTGLNQNWVNNSWEDYALSTYTYDSNNHLLTELNQSWENNSWVNSYLYTYTHDSNNNLLTRLDQNWVDNSWVNSLSVTYTYDSNDNLLTRLDQNWVNNSWKNNYLYTYTYDSKNNRLTALIQNWENNSWKDSFLSTYVYDSNHNLLTESQQRREDNSWVNYKQYSRIYDENGNGISVESRIWRNESWQPSHNGGQSMMSLWLYYNNMQNVFEMWSCDKMTASYVNITDFTAIKEPPASPELNAVSIYPNPTRGELRITKQRSALANYKLRITDIQVFDMAGVQVLHTQQTTLDISHLPAGIYFVQIKTEKGAVTKKIVKL